MSKNSISMCKLSHKIVLLIFCCRSMKTKNLFSLFCTHVTHADCKPKAYAEMGFSGSECLLPYHSYFP